MSDDRRETLRRRLEEIENLSSPSASLERILALTGDDGAGAAQLAEVIELDPAVTARVLRLANSAYFGFSRSVSSVREAIVVVGFRSVRNLAAVAAIAPAFAGDSDIDRPALWRHSCGVAEAARLVAARGAADDGSAYVCGLLHDLGQVALCEALGEEYVHAVGGGREPGTTLSGAETQALGADHAWAGAALCDHWKLPARIVTAIRWHHAPYEDPFGAAAWVALGDHLAEAEGLCDPADPIEGSPPLALLRSLQLEEQDFEELRLELRERREAIDMIYGETLPGTS